ncbi:DUF4148 domain-containing protein [Paraburkholderia nemoris]|uniref:DUF4148 domain-containing protein n=1 Tax=Paraburkholderia nemoris TaxID=2793076 RepID=UPI0038BC66E0
MNAIKLFTMTVAAVMSICTASQAAHAQSKSREQVRNELALAQHDGMFQGGKRPYPPNDDTSTRNKELHAISRHAGEKAPSVDQHDGLPTR